MSEKREFKNIYEKLLFIQQSVMGLGKDKAGFNYRYVTGDKALSHIKPLMNDLGLILKQEVLSIDNERMDYKVGKEQKDATEILSKVMMRFTWVDCETKETDVNLWGANGMNAFDKGVGSAFTYGERYFLLKFFHIATDEDDIDNPDLKKEAPTTTKQEPLKVDKPDLSKQANKQRQEMQGLAKEQPKADPKKALEGNTTGGALQPSKAFDDDSQKAPETKEEATQTSEELELEAKRKKNALGYLEKLGKAKVLKHLIAVEKMKYSDLPSFIEGESIAKIEEVYKTIAGIK